MSATTEQKFAELRRAYEELRQEHDAALAELQSSTAALGQQRSNGFDAGSRPTSDQDFATLRTENEELRAAQAASLEVLQALVASPGETQPVFDLIARRAARLCDVPIAAVTRFDGALIHLVAHVGMEPAEADVLARQFPRPPSQDIALGRAILNRRMEQIEDITAYPHCSFTPPPNQGSVLAVPLLRDEVPLGAIAIGRRLRGPFPRNQITLLQIFAEQAVIAISSAETYRALHARTADLQESLEYRTATNDVLKVISQSQFDLQPVLDTLVATAARLCGAEMAALARREGERFRLVASLGLPPEFEADRRLQGAFRFTTRSVSGRAVLERRAIHVPDASTDPDYPEVSVTVGRQRTSLGVPLLRGGDVIGCMMLARQRVEPFTDRQIELVSTFADQAVIAIENARLLTEQREALEQQTATAEVLQVINASLGNPTPVFEAILEKAIRLCGSSFGTLMTYDGHIMHHIAAHGLTREQEELIIDRPPTAGQPTGRIADGEDVVHLLDARDQEGYRDGFGPTRFFVDQVGARTAMWIALRKDKELLGILTIFRREVRAFTDKETELVQNFAAQAVIAMENARLLNEQRQALEQQTATAEVLQVINASPGDLAPVFETILEKAMVLCGAAFGSLYTFDGHRFLSAAQRGVPAAYAAYRESHPPELLGKGGLQQAVRTRRSTQTADMMADTLYLEGNTNVRAMVELGGIRTVAAIPLCRDDSVPGVISIFRQEVRPFSDRQIALLESFAAQAVIAMENARLLTEQREALEQQTATAEVLQVINASPGDLTPVFDAILEKAQNLCGGAFWALHTGDGETYRAVAARGITDQFADVIRQPFSPGPNHPVRQLIAGAPYAMVQDGAEVDDARIQSAMTLGGMHSALFVPLRKDNALLGYIVASNPLVQAFTNKHISLLQNFAAQAVIAVENARLLNEVRQRQEELRITFEHMGDGVAMFDDTQHLVAWNGKFQEIFDLPEGLLGQHLTHEEYLRFLAARGDFGADVETAEQILQLVASTGQPYGYERTRPDGRVIEVRRNPVPDGGFVLIFSDITERKRSEEEIRAARDAAEAAYRDLKTAQASLIQAEKMASLGQLTAGIAHEIKNPLNFVNNFASLSVDLLEELKQTAAPGLAMLDDARRAEVDDLASTLTSNLGKINEHGRRADGIVRSMLEHSRGSSGERRMIDFNALVDEALNLAYHGARAQDQSFNVTLQRDLGEGIAPIVLAPQDVTRVLLNLFSNGFYAARERQRTETMARFEPLVKVSTREFNGAVEIRVRDNGIGIPAEIKDRLFQPFFTTKPPGEGTGLGLSMSYDIITQQHSGSITVDSKVGEYSEFTVRLPRDG